MQAVSAWPTLSALGRDGIEEAQCPLLAQGGHQDCAHPCPLWGVKRTLDCAHDAPFFQRAAAAFLPSSLRCSGVSFAMRAMPPSRRIRFNMRVVKRMPAAAGIVLT